LVQDLTPGEIETRVGEMIRSMNGQKYILSAGCEITVNTPHENLLAEKGQVKNHEFTII
jgi:uroporphyrinogen-III decarboxylase